MLNVLKRSSFLLLVSDIAKKKSNSSEESGNPDDSTKYFYTNDFPKSGNGNAELQEYCVAFSVIKQFKKGLRIMKT